MNSKTFSEIGETPLAVDRGGGSIPALGLGELRVCVFFRVF
jgi:hypothetical protein